MTLKYPLDSNEVKIEVLRLVNEGWSCRNIGERLGISKTSVNDFITKRTYKLWWEENPKPLAAGEINDHHSGIKKLQGNRFILTSAQNSTFVHDGFLSSLETMAEENGAEIIVGTFSYNTNGFQNLEKSDGDFFDPKIEQYILDEPVLLADSLLWCGELNILPTAVNPLSGLHSYTKWRSGVVPHVKVQLESLPRHKEEDPRIMYTTGTVTKRNYIQKKSGQKASFHHVFGALYVEIDEDGNWFARQLVANSDTGHFQDLNQVYTPEGSYVNRVEAIQWGDIHVEKIDPEVLYASMGNHSNSMLNKLKPKYQFIHDVIDHTARNHHTINDPYHRFRTFHNQRDSVRDDIKASCSFLESIDRPWCKTVVVESNHDLALRRWLKEADYKSDPVNAIFFLELQLAMYKSIEEGVENFSVLEYAIKKINAEEGMKSNPQFLHEDESFMVCGIQCGCHGHLGIAGARGTAQSYAKSGSRANIGHSHTPKIIDGVYQAGHSTDISKMDYAKGLTTWDHSHIIVYPNGKRAIVSVKNGKWHA